MRHRKCHQHGNHVNAILRSWREGYRLRSIARRYGLTRTEVALIVAARGVDWSAIAVRERETSHANR